MAEPHINKRYVMISKFFIDSLELYSIIYLVALFYSAQYLFQASYEVIWVPAQISINESIKYKYQAITNFFCINDGALK